MEQAKLIFPFLNSLTDTEFQQLHWMKANKGEILLRSGDPCSFAVFLYEGEMKVSKTGNNGREINLYRVHSGQACILSITSSLSGQHYPAEAIVEKDSKLFLIPKQDLKFWLSTKPLLQDQVYQHMAARFIDMMKLFDNLFFRKIDERVLTFLLDHLKENGSVLSMTHDEIASELGSAREVISRIMKQFEKKGYIRISRGKIFMVNREVLINEKSNMAKL